ncbi:MAG TPA: PKD domain-containing protein, partial [Flavobacteriales bacterium]|nr:PKD domain-containing protein [Flavobacteriales bacterium]
CAVTFNIRDGVYIEQLQLNSITGSSDSTHIIFQSESGDSSAVIWSFASTRVDSNYTLFLNSTDYITLSNLTFSATGSSFSRAVVFDDADSLTFNNNAFLGNSNAQNSNTDQDLVYAQNATGDDVQFLNNRFDGGDYALYWDNSGYGQGCVVDNNVSMNSNQGFSFWYNDTLKVTSNNVTAKVRGIELRNCRYGSEVTKNRVHLLGDGMNTSYAVYLYNCTGDSASPVLVANNFIIAEGNPAYPSHGIFMTNSSDFNFIYGNSVNTTNQHANSSAFYMNSAGSNNTILNNILANFGGGVAVYSINSIVDYIVKCDFNAFYSSGNFIGFTDGFNIPSLNSWRFVTGTSSLDSNSVLANPYFNSTTDLHANQSALNNAGEYYSAVGDDIDGDIRDLVTPDIGADEFDLQLLDAGITEVNTMTSFMCDGVYSFYASIQNFGQNTLTSDTIYWSVESIMQPSVVWTGSLATGEEDDNVMLGLYAFVADTLNYNTLDVQVWTSSPNAGVDQNSVNDTNSTSFYPGLQGVFTIGSSSGADFSSFTDAVTFLNSSGGLCGPVVFNVEDSIYNEYVELYEYVGSSAANTITFQSISGDSTGVVLTYDGCGNECAVVYLDGADYIIFNQITVRQTSTWDYGIMLENGATNNIVRNCVIQTPPEEGYCIYSGDNDVIEDNNNSFIANRIVDGAYGIYWYGWISATNSGETGLTIIGNDFVNQDEYGVYVEYLDSVIVKNNSIVNLASAYQYYYGIYLYLDYTDGYFEVTGNTLNLKQAYAGLYLEYTSGSTMQPSLVTNNFISIESTGTSSLYGIYAYENFYMNVHNNSINLISTTSTNSKYAFYTEYGAGISILNNIFYNQTDGYAYYIDYPASAVIESDHNNIFAPSGTFGYWDNTGTEASLSSWQSATGFDANSFSMDPLFFTDYDLHTCNAQLDGTGISSPVVMMDIDGQQRDVNTPDIGADEFTAIGNIDLGLDDSLCAGDMMLLDAGASDGTYAWSTLESTQAIMVTTPGTYYVEVNSSCGMGMDTIVITADNSSAAAGFTYTTSTLSAVFSNTSSNATSYSWDFGDSGMSTDMDPIHIYSAPGTYTVTLIAFLDCKNDTMVQTVTVCETLNSGFTSTSSLLTATFTNSSVGAATYEWNFGDGDTSSQANPTHAYLSAGTYTVTLIGTNACETDTFVSSVTVGCSALNASFSSTAAGQVVTYANNSIGADSYSWDFGDGNTSSQTNPVNTYGSDGAYMVTLIATNACTSDTFQTQININTTGIIETSLITGMELFPNPSHGAITLHVVMEAPGVVHTVIYDLVGKKLYAEESYKQRTYSENIELGNLAKGIYLIRVESSGNVVQRKLILN